MPTSADEVAADLSKHEAVCAERYGYLRDDMLGLKRLVLWIMGIWSTVLLTSLGYLLVHYVVK